LRTLNLFLALISAPIEGEYIQLHRIRPNGFRTADIQ
jgi:hypothetical protein